MIIRAKHCLNIYRKIFGYNIIKNKKEYNQKGLIDSFGGLKLSSNVILAPAIEIQKIKKLSSEYKIKYKIFESWIRI